MPWLPCRSEPVPPGPWCRLRPALRPLGPPLIYSNNPESVTDLVSGGVLYESGGPLSGGLHAQVSGLWRVFYHHLNAAGEPFRLAVVVTNPAAGPVALISGRQGGPYIGGAGAGALALHDFLVNRPGLAAVTAVPPRGRRAVIDVGVGAGQVVSGVAEFVAVPRAAVSVITYRGGSEDDLPDPVLLPALPLHPLARPYANPPSFSSGPVRATFAHSRRLTTIVHSFDGPPGMLQVAARVRAADTPRQPDGAPLPGEYELGTAWVDDAVPVYVNGNYGVDYTFDLLVASAGGLPPAPERLAMRLSAGCPNPFCADGTPLVVSIGTEARVCAAGGPDFVWPYAAVPLAGPINRMVLRTGIPGGSCAPARHFLLS